MKTSSLVNNLVKTKPQLITDWWMLAINVQNFGQLYQEQMNCFFCAVVHIGSNYLDFKKWQPSKISTVVPIHIIAHEIKPCLKLHVVTQLMLLWRQSNGKKINFVSAKGKTPDQWKIFLVETKVIAIKFVRNKVPFQGLCSFK